jgi:hypothetical protein
MKLLLALKLLAVLSIIALAGCTTTATTEIGPACLGLGTITFSASQDSPETIRQIREHNAAWRALCSPVG